MVREVRQGGAVTPLITALEHLSFDSSMTGQWDQAQELADECLELCLTYGYLPLTWTVRYRQALLAAARGAYDASDELTVEMTEWAAPGGSARPSWPPTMSGRSRRWDAATSPVPTSMPPRSVRLASSLPTSGTRSGSCWT